MEARLRRWHVQACADAASGRWAGDQSPAGGGRPVDELTGRLRVVDGVGRRAVRCCRRTSRRRQVLWPLAGADTIERDAMAVVFSRATQALTADQGRGARW